MLPTSFHLPFIQIYKNKYSPFISFLEGGLFRASREFTKRRKGMRYWGLAGLSLIICVLHIFGGWELRLIKTKEFEEYRFSVHLA